MRLRMGELLKLPQEMRVLILSRLPPKSLMRFKCVHTSWNALISSSNFAAKHVSASKDNKLSSTATILFKRYALDISTERRDIVLSLLDLYNDDINCVEDDDNLNIPLEDLYVPQSMGLRRRDIWTGIECIELACHCNGIVCLTDYRKRVVLCNPAIKEFNRLPVSSLALYAVEHKPQGSSTAAVGFGCDIKCEEYKVVRVVYSEREFHDNDIVIHPPRAEVYSLATKCWKEIKAGELDNGSKNVWPDSTVSICNKGYLYWRGHEDEKEYFDVPISYTDEDANSGGEETFFYEDKERIVSFDIENETFHVMRFPNGYYYYHKVFGLWRDSIAVGLSWCADYQCVHIWVLDSNNDGAEGPWINCFAIEPTVYIEFQLAFVGTRGQSILVSVDKCVVVLYDYITKKVKYLPVNGVSLWSTQAVIYEYSVVSVKGYTD